MNKKLNFEIKEKIVQLSGACFWFWDSFYSFLESSGVSGSVYKLYPRESFNKYQVMRNLLALLEEKGEFGIINNIVSNFYKLNSAVDRDNVDTKKAKVALKEFKDLVGNDPIEREVEKREIEQKKQKAKEEGEKIIFKNNRLNDIKLEFNKLCKDKSISPQKRGFDVEKIFYNLLELEEFEFQRPFRNTGEQIDGHFRYEKFDYLVEIKWLDGMAKQEDLSVFDGKIRGKAQSTRGIFLSFNGFDQNAVIKFSGDSPRIILFDGQDFIQILDGYFSFSDGLKKKVDALVRFGKIFYKD
jgi:hypothetical protein